MFYVDLQSVLTVNVVQWTNKFLSVCYIDWESWVLLLAELWWQCLHVPECIARELLTPTPTEKASCWMLIKVTQKPSNSIPAIWPFPFTCSYIVTLTACLSSKFRYSSNSHRRGIDFCIKTKLMLAELTLEYKASHKATWKNSCWQPQHNSVIKQKCSSSDYIMHWGIDCSHGQLTTLYCSAATTVATSDSCWINVKT